MKRLGKGVLKAVGAPLAVSTVFALPPDVRTLDTPWTFPSITTRAAWEARAVEMRRTILFRAGLWPMPPRTPLNAQVFGRIERDGFTVEKAYFESVPGFFVTGNLYRPAAGAAGGPRPPFPAILAPHGHAAYGRLEASDIFNEPARAASLARQGYVVFTYDMVGYNDSAQVPHQYATAEASLWSFSVLGLQLWNAIRGLDFLESLPDVDGTRLGASGASGGGTQTFLLTAVDERVKASVPATMLSHYMQGGDNCENAAGLRLDHSNVEFAAMAAPRPMLLVSATGDWTRDTARVEYPAIRGIYALYGAEPRLAHVQFHAPHNFNREGREASYAFFAKWLKGVDQQPREASGAVESPANLLVWFGRERQPGVDANTLLEYWRRLPADPASVLTAVAPDPAAASPATREHRPNGRQRGVVLLAGTEDQAVIRALTRSGRAVHVVEPFRETRDTSSRYFTTYNRTADQIRVQDLLAAAVALAGPRGAIDLVGVGAGGPVALVAYAASKSAGAGQDVFRRVVADADRFPTRQESAYLDRLFIPGLLRAGGFAALPPQDVLVHNTGGVFQSPGELHEERLDPAAIAAWLGRR
jgi:dienelactone hydrolase